MAFFPGLKADGDDVFREMLAIGIRSDKDGMRRGVTEEVVDSGAQGRALAEIGRVLKKLDLGADGRLLKDRIKGRSAAIVDEDDPGDPLI